MRFHHNNGLPLSLFTPTIDPEPTPTHSTTPLARTTTNNNGNFPRNMRQFVNAQQFLPSIIHTRQEDLPILEASATYYPKSNWGKNYE